MTVHLLKLAVGVDDIDHLAAIQERRRQEAAAAGRPPVARHMTRSMPRRAEEVLDGGSIYWVIRRVIQVRQRIVGLDIVTADDGTPRCAISLDAELIPTEPRPCRPFQGWRYLEPDAAPPDASGDVLVDADMPQPMREELRALGLL